MSKETLLTVKRWISWKTGAISRAAFFRAIDDYIQENDSPEYRYIMLAHHEAQDDYFVEKYFYENIIDLDSEAARDVTFTAIIESYIDGVLEIDQVSKALVIYFLNDEWGELESPSDDINALYGQWVGGISTLGDVEYFETLKALILHYMSRA
ncbi:hypothetical protein [Hahella sp. HN01]|uniref:hypothetical protein n=1 Tax=unclassified Hahella TaxID=2624107 RepID=UPI001C1E952A|nr:hypothetical protein [Hahella sp. HN01]MBU6952612.1 hypothetical protein [Hahella sp. HN01]